MSTYRRILVGFVISLLMISRVVAQQSTPTPLPIFPLQVGVPVEGNLNDSTPLTRFNFDARAGAEILIVMETTSGELDPLIWLLSPNGAELAQNDDLEPGVRNAALSLSLPSDGIYTVVATRQGETTGSYALLLEIAGDDIAQEAVDPLTLDPADLFSVPLTTLAYQGFGAGTLDDENPRLYFAVGGEQGDLLRAILTVTDGDLAPVVNILSPDLTTISTAVHPRDGEVIAFSALPQRHWYLIEVTRESGSGSFSLFVDGLAAPHITYNEPNVNDEFTVNTLSKSFIFAGKMGDLVFASTVIVDGDASPQMRLLDIAQREIASADGSRFTSLQASLPRSSTYILQVNNTSTGTTGAFNLRLSAVETTIDSLNPQPAAYNNAYGGTLNAGNPRTVYAFNGKRGDIITARMDAISASLDPFLLLMDANLNELVVNDNSPGTRNARIVQYALPADGTYYLAAARQGVTLGTSYGSYSLTLTVGAIALEQGAVAATVRWTGDDDLNLFIREPSGRVISWSNPTPPGSGTLQIDSNTGCDAISAQPVEHIYWQPGTFPADGDYELWVWYQEACELAEPVTFAFQLRIDGAIVLDIPEEQLEPGERLNIDLRFSEPDAFVLDAGRVTEPSPQQRISEGGDIPILYGESVNGSLNDEVYARFYQFQGNAGDVIEVGSETLTGSLDPVLVLRDDTERNLVTNDDHARGNRAARLTYTLPTDGRYVIAVTRFGVRDGLTVGDYRLTLRRTETDAE